MNAGTMLNVCDVLIRRDLHGRFSLNDLHRAAGGEGRHSPNRWTRTDAYAALVGELTPELAFAPAESMRGGTSPGTYVVRELVYAFAMWISPAFHLRVIRAYDAAQAPITVSALDDPATLRHLLLNYAGRVEQLEAEVRAAEPDLRALEELAKSGGSLCLRDSAKAVGLPEGEFLQFLHAHGWIYRRPGSGTWHGYALQEQRGRLVHKVYTQEPPADAPKQAMPKIREQVRLTPKGIVDAARLLKRRTPAGSGAAAAIVRAECEAKLGAMHA
jgi:hypothetical protein